MNNTAASAPVAAITNHDEWVAFYSTNISDFARTQLRESDLAEVAAGDYLAMEYVAGVVSEIARLEALSDAELRAEQAESKAAHWAAQEDEDYSEYDVNDYESYYYLQGLIEELLADRSARARYTGLAPLSHSPFAGLKVA